MQDVDTSNHLFCSPRILCYIQNIYIECFRCPEGGLELPCNYHFDLPPDARAYQFGLRTKKIARPETYSGMPLDTVLALYSLRIQIKGNQFKVVVS